MTPAGPAPHVPVLVDEVVHALAVAPGETHVDGTFGAGGYTKAILDKGAARVFAFDRDPLAIQYGEALAADCGGRLTLVPERFSRMRQALADRGVSEVDGVEDQAALGSVAVGHHGAELDGAQFDLRAVVGPGHRAVVDGVAVLRELGHELEFEGAFRCVT